MEIHNDVKRFIQHTVKEFTKHCKKDIERSFNKIKIPGGNLYFIYDSEITIIFENISSYQIEPIGLILESDDGNYTYYNFNDDYTNVDEIVQSFVKNCLI